MAHDGAAVQQVVVTALEKRCWGIIECGRGSGSELFNQKGGELKGEIKMFLRFPDGFFFFPFLFSPFALKSSALFLFLSASYPHLKEYTLSWDNNNNLVFELGGKNVKGNKYLLLYVKEKFTTKQVNENIS